LPQAGYTDIAMENMATGTDDHNKRMPNASAMISDSINAESEANCQPWIDLHAINRTIGMKKTKF
jgi:hypothetical protein